MNTAYTDPYSAEHSFVTVAQSLVTTNKSVSTYNNVYIYIILVAKN